MSRTTADALGVVEDALRQAGCHQVGDRGCWTCPVHDDGSPSLSVNRGHTVAVVMNCFAGCPTKDILAATGLTKADLDDRADRDRARPPRPPTTRNARKAPRRRDDGFRPAGPGELEAFLAMRGWRAEVAERFGLTAVLDGFGHVRIRFPFRVDGEVVTWQDRALDDRKPKYLSARGRKLIPFAADLRSALGGDVVVLVEGPSDVIALAHCFPTGRVIGLPGATWAGRSEVAGMLRGLDVFVAMDNDQAGEDGRSGVASSLSAAGCRVGHLYYPAEFNDLDAWRRSYDGDDAEFAAAFLDRGNGLERAVGK